MNTHISQPRNRNTTVTKSVPSSAKLLRDACLRGGIALVIMGGITLSMVGNNPAATIQSMIASTIISVAVAAATVIYDIPGWSLKKQSIVHTLAMFVTVYPAIFLGGWAPLTFQGALMALGIFAMCGLVLWSIGAAVFIYIINPRQKKG